MSGNSYVQPNKTYLTTKPNLIKKLQVRVGMAWHVFICNMNESLEKNDKFSTDLTRNTFNFVFMTFSIQFLYYFVSFSFIESIRVPIHTSLWKQQLTCTTFNISIFVCFGTVWFWDDKGGGPTYTSCCHHNIFLSTQQILSDGRHSNHRHLFLVKKMIPLGIFFLPETSACDSNTSLK